MQCATSSGLSIPSSPFNPRMIAASTSIDGQHRLQEEFERLQKDKEAEAAEKGSADGIDWSASTCSQSRTCTDFSCQTSGGMLWEVRRPHAFCHAFLKPSIDYTRFAAEHPEELSQAIAKGIPSSLRGMMWQLM